MPGCCPATTSWPSSASSPRPPARRCRTAGPTGPTSSTPTRRPRCWRRSRRCRCRKLATRATRRAVASPASALSYDFDAQRLLPAPAVPEAFAPLRERAAAWIGVPRRGARRHAGRRVPTRRSARLAPRRAAFRNSGRRLARRHGAHALSPLSAGAAEEGRRALARARAALGLRAACRGALGLAAQRRADAGAALLDHLSARRESRDDEHGRAAPPARGPAEVRRRRAAQPHRRPGRLRRRGDPGPAQDRRGPRRADQRPRGAAARPRRWPGS